MNWTRKMSIVSCPTGGLSLLLAGKSVAKERVGTVKRAGAPCPPIVPLFFPAIYLRIGAL